MHDLRGFPSLRRTRNLYLGALIETVRDQTRIVDLKLVNRVLIHITSSAVGAMPYRYTFLGAAGPYGCQCSIQPRCNRRIRPCPKHRFLFRPPVRRAPPHTKDASFVPRLADAA